MVPDQVSNPGPLTYESGALPIALRGAASLEETNLLRPEVIIAFNLLRNRHISLLCM